MSASLVRNLYGIEIYYTVRVGRRLRIAPSERHRHSRTGDDRRRLPRAAERDDRGRRGTDTPRDDVPVIGDRVAIGAGAVILSPAQHRRRRGDRPERGRSDVRAVQLPRSADDARMQEREAAGRSSRSSDGPSPEASRGRAPCRMRRARCCLRLHDWSKVAANAAERRAAMKGRRGRHLRRRDARPRGAPARAMRTALAAARGRRRARAASPIWRGRPLVDGATAWRWPGCRRRPSGLLGEAGGGAIFLGRRRRRAALRLRPRRTGPARPRWPKRRRGFSRRQPDAASGPARASRLRGPAGGDEPARARRTRASPPRPRACSPGTPATASAPAAARPRRSRTPAGSGSARPAAPSISRAPTRWSSC